MARFNVQRVCAKFFFPFSFDIQSSVYIKNDKWKGLFIKKKKKTVYWYTCKKKKSYLLTSLSNFILISWTNHEFIIQFNYLRLSYITRDPILDFVKFLMDSGMIEAPTSSGWFIYLCNIQWSQCAKFFTSICTTISLVYSCISFILLYIYIFLDLFVRIIPSSWISINSIYVE